MLERALALGIVGYSLAAAMQFVFIGEQTFQTHWPSGVKFAVADSQLGAQAIAKAIGKARGGVVEDAGSVNFIHEQISGVLILGKDALCVARAVMIDVFDRFIQIAYDLYRNLQIAVFGVPVLIRGRNDLA